MMSELRLSVIICAYTERRAATLTDAAAAAARQLRSGDELIVVVDHNDALLSQLKGMLTAAGVGASDSSPALSVIGNSGIRGLSAARNTGIAHATGDLLLFLDDDAIPRDGWVEGLAEAFTGPDVVAAGGVAVPAWEAPPPRWFPDEFLWVVGCSYRGLPTVVAQIRNPIGANMAFRREAVVAAGGFKDGIGRVGRTPLGCEETELSIRVRKISQGRILQQPHAVVDHLVPVDRVSWRYFAHRCWAEGLSKAVVSGHVGDSAALSSERSYVVRTLSSGTVMGLRDLLRGDPHGLSRAVAIVVGFGITTAGYLRGRASPLRD